MYRKEDLPQMLKELEQMCGFSDVYLSVGSPVRFKHKKKLYSFTSRPLKEDEIKQFLLFATQDNAAFSNVQTQKKGLSGAFSIGSRKGDYHHRYRYEACTGRNDRGRHTLDMIIRSLSARPVPLDEQDVTDDLRAALTDKEPGIALIGGATGSGKTTLLSGAIYETLITSDDDRVILTIEDPIEIVFDKRPEYGNNHVKQRELHTDFKSFGLAIRSFLRQGPTDILVGEMRDLETIQETLKAANTGHRVFGTIHVNTVPDIPARIISEFPEESRRGRLLEFLSISKLWMTQRLEINPKGGLTALRSYLVVDSNIVDEIFKVKPNDVRSRVAELVEEYGVTMERAAKHAYDAGNIDEITYHKIKWGA